MAANRYPEGMVDWIKANYINLTLPELTEICNDIFKTNLSKKAMSSLKKRYGLTGAPRAKVYSGTFPEEICCFIEENYLGTGHQQMADLIRKEFGQEYTAQQIKSYYANHDLNSGLTGHFKKGQASHNKGVKMSPEVYEKAKVTMFKPGSRPHNAVPVGTVVMATIGYYKEKVAEPDEWEFCHIKAWKDAHGEIPEGMIVSFKDGNREDWSIENLILLTREENAYLNGTHMRSEFPEITAAAANVAKLVMKTRKIRKERRKGSGSVL